MRVLVVVCMGTDVYMLLGVVTPLACTPQLLSVDHKVISSYTVLLLLVLCMYFNIILVPVYYIGIDSLPVCHYTMHGLMLLRKLGNSGRGD